MSLVIRQLMPDTPEAELAARWRYDAFFADGGDTFENSRAALLDFLRKQDGYEIALLAECDDKPAGLCLFVRDEADPNPRPDLSPWLAALYVAAEFRGRGIGGALVQAIEEHARAVGAATLYLYTAEAEPFYAGLGWIVRDRFTQNGEANALMARELSDPMAGKASKKAPKKTAAKRTKAAPPKLLSGGNPQIAKAYGDGPVQAYIAAMPGWKSSVGQRLDALITRAVPGVRKAVKWNSPLYGMEDNVWFLGIHCFTKYIKVAFFRGAALTPVPPGTSKQKDVRYLDIREEDHLDEAQFTAWVKQASKLPGEKM